MTEKRGKTVIGLVGLPAAGKGTIADYLERVYGAKKLRFSDPLSDILSRVRLPPTRDNMIKLSEILRAAFGEDLLAKTLKADADRFAENLIVIDGVRREADIALFGRTAGFHLLSVVAAPEIRWERSRRRGEKPEEGELSYQEFLALEQRSTEVSAKDLLGAADETISNNGSFEEFYAAIDRVLAKLGVSPL